MAQTDYKLTIDDEDVEKSLKEAQKEFNKTAKVGDDAMKKVGKSAEELGDGIRRNVNGRLIDANGKFVNMGKTGDKALKGVGKSGLSMSHVMSGAVGGAFASLATAALEFGKQAVLAFERAVMASVDAANEFDVTRKKFISIFDGDEKAADAVMDHISQRALKLGMDMNEALSLSRSFLPDVKGSDDPLGAIDDLLLGVRALAEEDPMQGIAGARIAIDEAMSGSLRSLKQRFEFTKAEIDILKAAQGELGEVAGTIEGINTVMERRGFDAEALAGTYTQAMGEMTFATSKLQVETGKPIADQITESMTDLNKIVAENSDDLELMAAAIGDLIAKATEFIGTNLTGFLEGVDTEGVLNLVDGLNSAGNSATLLMDVLFDLDDATLFNSLIGDLTTIVEKIGEATQTASKLGAIAKAELAYASANAKVLGIGGKLFASAEKKAAAASAAQAAYDQVIKDSLPSFEKFSEVEKADTERKKERVKAQNENTDAALAEGEAFLKEGDAASETSDALAELGLAEEDLVKIKEDVAKTQEKIADTERQFAQERLDIERDFQQERFDLALQFSQERQDIERQSLLDIAAIQADHVRAVEDEGLQLNRSSRDMGKKHGQERSDAAKDLRRDLISIEENYQDELRRINRQAQQSMEDAERGLDAQAFIAALRQQEVAQEEAGIGRQEAEAEARTGNQERLEDLETAQAEERATLNQSNQDKLEDLQIQLSRELEAQALSDQLAFEQQGIDEMRRVEQQIISEERRMEQQAIDEQRKYEALALAQAERLAKMVEGLDAETAAVILAEANKLAAVEDFAGASQAIMDGLVAHAQQGLSEIATKSKIIDERNKKDKSKRAEIVAKKDISLAQLTGANQVEAATPAMQGPLVNLTGLTGRRFGGQVVGGRGYRVGETGFEGYIPHRALGGDVRIGQPTILGELGEELFIPPSSGTIIPNNQMGSFLGGETNMQQSISNTENNLGGFSVSQSMFEDPIQRGQLENFILDVMSRG